MWIHHAFQQKGKVTFGQKDGRERESERCNYAKPRLAPSGPRSSTKKGMRIDTISKVKGNRRRKKYTSDWRRWRSQEDQQASERKCLQLSPHIISAAEDMNESKSKYYYQHYPEIGTDL